MAAVFIGALFNPSPGDARRGWCAESGVCTEHLGTQPAAPEAPSAQASAGATPHGQETCQGHRNNGNAGMSGGAAEDGKDYTADFGEVAGLFHIRLPPRHR